MHIRSLTLTVAASVSAVFAEPLRSVLMFRHCPRSCSNSLTSGAPGFNNLNNYSAQDFPPWPVADMECLPAGIDLVESAGAQLGSTFPTPLRMQVDSNAKRDNDTAAALLRGMGLPEADFEAAPCLFNPANCGFCDGIDSETKKAAIDARYAAFPPPQGLDSLLEDIQLVLGAGEAPALEDIPDSVSSSGTFTGGSSAASAITEVFLEQMAGNLTLAWGEMSATQVYAFEEAHIYYRGVMDRALPVVAYYHTYVTNEIMSFLSSGSGTLVLVGHDTELDALAEIFGLSWSTSPFPPNATTPGSALRFDVQEDQTSIAASIHYQAFDGTTAVQTVPVDFTWSASSATPSLAEIRTWLEPRLDSTCSPKSV